MPEHLPKSQAAGSSPSEHAVSFMHDAMADNKSVGPQQWLFCFGSVNGAMPDGTVCSLRSRVDTDGRATNEVWTDLALLTPYRPSKNNMVIRINFGC